MSLLKFVTVVTTTMMLIACGRTNDGRNVNTAEGQPSANSNKAESEMTGAQIIDAFKEAGLPIGSVVFYTEENDPNKLLGRPGQYIEKAKWADTRVEQIPDYNPAHKGIKEDMDPDGGGIEVFRSAEDLRRRKNYLEQPLLIGPPLVEYRYVLGNSLVRLDRELTPKQAAGYESIINRLGGRIASPD